MTSPPLDIGDEMEVDDIEASDDSGMAGTMLAMSIWPTDTDIVCAAGMNIKISLQSHLLQVIFHNAIEGIHCYLLFEQAFPKPTTIPSMVRKCIVDAVWDLTTCGGRYNASAACVHQHILSDINYHDKIICLVSSTTLHSMTSLI